MLLWSHKGGEGGGAPHRGVLKERGEHDKLPSGGRGKVAENAVGEWKKVPGVHKQG